MSLKRKVSTSVAAVAMFAFSSATAFAATTEEITEALTKLLTASGTNSVVEVGEPTEEGDTLVYSGIAIDQPPNAEGEVRQGRITTLSLTGADLDENGSLVAESVVAEGLTATSNDGNRVAVEQIEIDNLVAPIAAEGEEAAVGRYDSIRISNIDATDENNQNVVVDSVSLVNEDFVGDYPRSVDIAVEGITIDVAKLEAEQAQPLQGLGYETVRVNLFGNGNYAEETGQIDIERLAITADEMGSLTLTGEITGVTPDVVGMLQQPNPSPDAFGMIKIGRATLTYEDSSLATRILDQQATAQGTTREAFAEQLSAALPLLLSAVQNPAFQGKLATAAGAFLKDPQNISITIAPAQPMSLLEIAGTVQAAPNTLPDVLNADVQANQAQ